MMNAFSCYVYGSYERFLPYYIYSINKNYPEAEIVVFYEGILNLNIKNYISSYDKLVLYDNFNFEKKTEWLKDYKIKGGGTKSLLRFLINGKFFRKYKYVYFGDVDILVLKEKQSLFDFHAKQLHHNNLPFSNKVRYNSNIISKRLTGLHFVEVKPYFDSMNSVISDFLDIKRYRDKLMIDVTRDEELLYNLNMSAFKFDPNQLIKNKRPWHGFHLGLVRGRNYLNLKTIKENSSLSVPQLKKELSRLNENGEINNLLGEFYCREVYFTYKTLGLKLSPKVHFKYETKQLKYNIISILKSIRKFL